MLINFKNFQIYKYRKSTMSCSNSGQVPIDEDNNYSQNEIELNKIIGQV